MRWLARATAAGSVVGSMMGPAVAQNLVGYVVSADGEAPTLLRGSGPPRRLRLGESILAGDTVTVRLPARVRVDTASGPIDPCSPPPVDGTECRYRFASSGGLTPSAIMGRLSAMVSWFSAPSRNFVTRSAEPPTFKIGAGARQNVASGRRELLVSWYDGQPPFRLTVEAGGSALVEMRTERRTVRLPAARILDGPATLTVVDGLARTAKLPLMALSAPPRSSDFGPHAVDRDHRTLLEAAELATRDDGAWSLEAVQRLGDLGERSQVAAQLRDALFAGDRP